jgi:hypothetical protein
VVPVPGTEYVSGFRQENEGAKTKKKIQPKGSFTLAMLNALHQE